MTRTTIFLTEEQRKAIFALAHEKETTFSEVIRRAIDTYIDTPMVVIAKGTQYVAEVPARILRNSEEE